MGYREMRLTRDSQLLYLGALIGVAAYLMADPLPFWQWSYHHWLQALSVAGIWYMGMLRTSPLPGENDPVQK